MVILLVALSLSMDAFSLALIYGVNSLSKKNEIILSVIVGLFHFIMPLLGYIIGEFILEIFPIQLHTLVTIIFTLIGIDMIIDSLKETKYNLITSISGMLLFGLAVSIDSFGIGIGFDVLTNNVLTSSIVFMLISGILTYIGLSFGKIIGKKIGKISNLIGGLVLVILGVIYLFK